MQCRSGAGRQKASSGATSASAAFRSAPCQAPGPYPSSMTRASTVASNPSGIVVLALVVVLMITSVCVTFSVGSDRASIIQRLTRGSLGKNCGRFGASFGAGRPERCPGASHGTRSGPRRRLDGRGRDLYFRSQGPSFRRTALACLHRHRCGGGVSVTLPLRGGGGGTGR